MKKLLAGIFSLLAGIAIGQCEINTTATALTVTCGQSVDLSAFGSSTGQVVLDEDFDGSTFGAGWSNSPGSTSFTNPCSPGGVDGTPHAWMDNNTAVPRTLTSQAYDLTAASAGVSICFDLLFAEQGDAAPCEGPDEPDEGVFLQYSIDGGGTWIDIHYFDPNGGNDPQLVNWNNWCFDIPLAAITGNTFFRWHQSADSGADYDHWGIDNVQIFQNDINAEVTWLHDGYSYGIGSPGGVNPTAVTPTSTTTYTAQIETGTGDVCFSDITITVVDPVYDVNVTADPTTVCSGDCSDITGNAQIILDPGGIETYENNEFEIVATGSASVNINIQTLNMTGVESGSIQEVCINGFNYSGSELCTNLFGGCDCNGTPISFGESCEIDASSFNITLTSPNGCEITLVPSSTIMTTGIQDMCFVPTGGAGIGSGSGNYTGQFDPTDPISNLDGCDANGVWTLEFNTGTGGLGFGFGSLTGWSITFDDPPITQPVNATWSPTTGLSSTNTLATTACPAGTTDYLLTLDNGVPGCPVHEETVTITVDPCGGCVPPVFTVTDPASACAPFSYDLVNAVSGTGANIVSYHASLADANADANPLGSTTVSTADSYYVRVEDSGDPTCFSVQEIVVDATALDDPSFSLTNFCEGSVNAASGITSAGGTFTFNPAVADGATVDASTGEITDGVVGTTYTLEYTTSGTCSASSTEDVTVNSSDDASFDLTNYCVGTANAATNIITAGGTFAFNPAVADGATVDASTGEITDGVVGTTYTLEYTTSGACSASSTEDVTVNSSDDASFDLTNYCVGTANAATNIITAGGTFVFNPAIADGATVDASTGEITDGVVGTTYTLEYTTSGACSASSTEDVTVNSSDDASFDLTNYCVGTANAATNIITAGGTFVFNPAIADGATVDASTGEITDGVVGTTYTLEYTTSGACSASSTEDVTVNSSDDASFDLTNYCVGTANAATNIITAGGTFVFNPAVADGATVDASTGEITDGVVGTTYTLEYTTSGACSASSTEDVTVNSSDDASFDLTNYCVGTANAATNIVTAGGTFVFNPAVADGATVDASTGEITDGVVGTTYTLEYSTSGACSASSTEDVTVNSSDDASFDLTNYCVGTANAATNIITAGGTFVFNPAVADGATVDASTGEITDGVVGTTYTLEYTTSGACSASSTEDVTVNSSDDASFDLTNYCVGTANAATNIVTAGGTFVFNPAVADGATVDASTGEITDGVVGTTYTLEYSTSGACSASSTEDVTVNSSDDASFDLTNYCVGTANAATNIITAGGTFVFNPAVADGATIDASTGEITDGVGGTTYTIEYTTIGACSASSTENVVVNVLPVPSIVGSTQYCTGTPANLSTDQVYASYDWSNGLITQNGSFTIVDNPISVTITDLNGCVGTSPEVNVAEGNLSPQFSADIVSGCAPLTVVFTNTTIEPTNNCNWTFGNGSTSNDCGPVTVIYESGGTYNVSLTGSTATGCTGTTTEDNFIYVENPPDASFYVTGSNLSGLNTTVDLMNTSIGASSYEWNFGDTSQSVSTENPSHMYPVNSPGTYIVELVAFSTLGCTDTAWNSVTVKDELIYYIPNTFTPDDDGYNQEFKPIFTEGFDPYDYKLLIFNRWGEIIFESNDANYGWDGTYGGKQAQDGTYVWTIEFKTTQSDERVNINGHLNKLR